MKNSGLKRVLKYILKTVIAIVLFLVGYFLFAIILSYTTANSDFKSCEKDAIEIYILTNGVHTDLVVPFKNNWKDWSTFVDPGQTRSGETNVTFASFGWGDKGFYLETPTWADLKFSTAFKAMLFLSSSAMHVTFYKRMKESESCKKISITPESYKKLIKYLESSFKLKEGKSLLIAGVSYWDNDIFYDANGTYNLFKTCNTWANSGLKSADLKACQWTPFDKGIFYQYSNR